MGCCKIRESTRRLRQYEVEPDYEGTYDARGANKTSIELEPCWSFPFVSCSFCPGSAESRIASEFHGGYFFANWA
ncbi:hypothetical protein PM082_000348 [Marasmius tenuissimus]|nr:hypothetical protein PM082_000348 [Marasmius tenuissimus]